MTAQVANAKQGLVRRPTYAELIKEIDRDKFKTNDIRKVFDRNAWYYHDSPLNPANNTHPADLQQMNFKKMTEEATARKEEEMKPFDVEDITDLRDDAISDFEMSFDRERELREENERRVAEQVNLSHAEDHYMANKGAYDAIGATASAGIQEDEEPAGSRSVLKQFLKSSKPIIKAVATAGGTAKGGSIGGLIAEKLTDAILPDDDKEATTPKPKPPKKTIQKITHPKKEKEKAKPMEVDTTPDDVLRKYHNQITDETMALNKRRPITHGTTQPKKQRSASTAQEKREFHDDPSTTTKPPPKRRTRGKQPQQPTLQTINIRKDNKTPDVEEAPKAKEETQASSSTKTPIRKTNKQSGTAPLPSKVGIQVMREKFQEMNNRKTIQSEEYEQFQEVYGKWKSSKGDQKKQHLKDAQKLYKSCIYPKIK